MVDRREHPRIRLRRKVGIQLSSGDIVYAWTYDLSLGGIQILSEYSADSGDEFNTFLGVLDPVSGTHGFVEMRVRIVHMIYDGTDGCFRIGTRIVKFRNAASRDLYVRFLESKMGTPLEHAG